MNESCVRLFLPASGRLLVAVLVCVCCASIAHSAESQTSSSTSQQRAQTAVQPQVKQTDFASTKGFVLEDQTPIRLRLNRTISSADAHVGDSVDFEVLDDITLNGVVIVAKGGLALATVTESQAKKRMARGGKLDINIDYVKLISGEKAALRAVRDVKGGGHTGGMVGGMVATSLVFFPAAPFFLFMHGKDISIPKGTEITAYVNGDVRLDTAKFQPGGLGSDSVVIGSASNSKQNGSVSANLQVESDPTGADIEIDGVFSGNTPSSLGVAAGEHTVRISKRGFVPWERKIRSSSGNVRIIAELETSAAPAGSPAPPTVDRSTNVSQAVTVPQEEPPASSVSVSVTTPVSLSAPASVATPVRPTAIKVAEPISSSGSAPKPTIVEMAAASSPSAEGEGTASVTSNPDGAEIFVDSVGRGRAPAFLKLKAGKHKIQLAAEGYKDWVGEIDMKSGSIVNVTGNLEK